ncbi:protein of unknown function [Magnetospirillum sp. XM-1]|nr:protein of unknown function [Magnetospirillum sp. XM-1]
MRHEERRGAISCRVTRQEAFQFAAQLAANEHRPGLRCFGVAGRQHDLVLHATIAVNHIAKFQMGNLANAHPSIEAEHERNAVTCCMTLICDNGQHALEFRFAEYLGLFHRFT